MATYCLELLNCAGIADRGCTITDGHKMLDDIKFYQKRVKELARGAGEPYPKRYTLQVSQWDGEYYKPIATADAMRIAKNMRK